jgi:hypothetical protein
MKLASSLSRKAINFPTSSGYPILTRALLFSIVVSEMLVVAFAAAVTIGVLTRPGAIAFTRIFLFPTSLALLLVIPFIPFLLGV